MKVAIVGRNYNICQCGQSIGYVCSDSVAIRTDAAAIESNSMKQCTASQDSGVHVFLTVEDELSFAKVVDLSHQTCRIWEKVCGWP